MTVTDRRILSWYSHFPLLPSSSHRTFTPIATLVLSLPLLLPSSYHGTFNSCCYPRPIIVRSPQSCCLSSSCLYHCMFTSCCYPRPTIVHSPPVATHVLVSYVHLSPVVCPPLLITVCSPPVATLVHSSYIHLLLRPSSSHCTFTSCCYPRPIIVHSPQSCCLSSPSSLYLSLALNIMHLLLLPSSYPCLSLAINSHTSCCSLRLLLSCLSAGI